MHPKEQLHQYGLRPKRSFGQNFLTDPNIARKIVETALPEPGGNVVEIGPGLGALTGLLLERADNVTAIEVDRDLAAALRRPQNSLQHHSKLVVLEQDAKAADLIGLLRQGPAPAVLIGNLPYNITGPLIRRAIEVADCVARTVFLIQQEVCDRLTAAPGTSAYGAMTVFVQLRYSTRRAFVVRRGAFFPQPGVDSALVVLTPHGEPMARETDTLRKLIHAAFAQRRKKLKNAWNVLNAPGATALAPAAARAGIDLDARGERLSVADFVRMAQELDR